MTERTQRPPKRVTPAYLKNVALHYLGQRSSSRANLRRLLVRRVERSLTEYGGERGEQLQWVDTLLDELVRLQLLDDARYAAQRASSLTRMGQSSRKVRAKLAEKGLPTAVVNAALDELRGSGPSPDLLAAFRFARSRKLGPYRRALELPLDREARQKELAKLARAGFPYEIAIRVVDCETVEMVDEMTSDGDA